MAPPQEFRDSDDRLDAELAEILGNPPTLEELGEPAPHCGAEEAAWRARTAELGLPASRCPAGFSRKEILALTGWGSGSPMERFDAVSRIAGFLKTRAHPICPEHGLVHHPADVRALLDRLHLE